MAGLSFGDLQTSPILFLRDHTSDVPLYIRQLLHVCNFSAQDDDTGKLTAEKSGDMTGAHVWIPTEDGNRWYDTGGDDSVGLDDDLGNVDGTGAGYAAHSFATAAATAPDGLRAILTPFSELSEDLEPKKYAPKETEGWGKYRSALGHRSPVGEAGVLLQTVDQDEGRLMFFPSGDLVAQHLGQDAPNISTRVHDLTKAGYRDWDREAGLHSHLFVAQHCGALGGEYQACWNCTTSLGDETGWGSYIADADGGGQVLQNQVINPGGHQNNGHIDQVVSLYIPPVNNTSPTPELAGKAIALASWEQFGPFHPGSGKDQHNFGANANGVVENSGHIWTRALYYANRKYDGPLDFTLDKHPKCGDYDHPVLVNLKWDADEKHQWALGHREGMWKWSSSTPWERPTPPWTTDTPGEPPLTPYEDLVPPPDPVTAEPIEGGGGGGGNIIGGEQDIIGGTLGGGIRVGDGPGRIRPFATPGQRPGFRPGTETVETPDPIATPIDSPPPGTWNPDNEIARRAARRREFERSGKGQPFPGAGEELWQVSGQPIAALDTRLEISAPSMWFSAVREYTSQRYDGRFSAQWAADERKAFADETGGPPPYTGHFQGFASVVDGQWDLTTGADTKGDGGEAYFRRGTADGGIWFAEPERLLDGGYGGSYSTTYLAMSDAIRFGWGTPTADGLLASGAEIRHSATALTVIATDAAGAIDAGAGHLTVNGISSVYDGSTDAYNLEHSGSEVYQYRGTAGAQLLDLILYGRRYIKGTSFASSPWSAPAETVGAAKVSDGTELEAAIAAAQAGGVESTIELTTAGQYLLTQDLAWAETFALHVVALVEGCYLDGAYKIDMATSTGGITFLCVELRNGSATGTQVAVRQTPFSFTRCLFAPTTHKQLYSIYSSGQNSPCSFESCIFVDSATRRPLDLGQNVGNRWILRNCVIMAGASTSFCITDSGVSAVDVHNCAFQRDAGAATCSLVTPGGDHNAATDATAPGANSYDNITWATEYDANYKPLTVIGKSGGSAANAATVDYDGNAITTVAPIGAFLSGTTVTDGRLEVWSQDEADKAILTPTLLTVDSLALTSGSTVTTIKDEDDMASDLATALATQQSIKAYVDAQVGAENLWDRAGTVLSPHTVGDDVTTSGVITGGSLVGSDLTATRIPYAGAGSVLGDSANLTYSDATPTLTLGTDVTFARTGVKTASLSTDGVDNLTVTNAGASIVAGVGSVSAPDIAFYGDPDTGIYRHSDNVIGLAAEGVSHFRMTEKGIKGYSSYKNVGSEYLFFPEFHNLLYHGHYRFGVTLTNFTTGSAYYLFDGSYESYSTNKVAAATSAKINIDLTANSEYDANGVIYPYGMIHLNFYGGTGLGANLTITGRVKDKYGAWHAMGAGAISSAASNDKERWSLVMPNNPYAVEVEITIATGALPTEYGLVQVEWESTRASLNAMPLLTKYATESIYQDWTWRDSSNAQTIKLDNAGYIEVGGGTSASSYGDFSCGDGTREMFFDANIGCLTLTGSHIATTLSVRGNANSSASSWTGQHLKLNTGNIASTTGQTTITLATSTADAYGISLAAHRYTTNGHADFVIREHYGTAAGSEMVRFGYRSSVASITLAGDMDTAITHPVADSLGFELGGSEQTRFTKYGHEISDDGWFQNSGRCWASGVITTGATDTVTAGTDEPCRRYDIAADGANTVYVVNLDKTNAAEGFTVKLHITLTGDGGGFNATCDIQNGGVSLLASVLTDTGPTPVYFSAEAIYDGTNWYLHHLHSSTV